jgi:hypothetical protein
MYSGRVRSKNSELPKGDSTRLVRRCLPMSFPCLKQPFTDHRVLLFFAEVRRRCCTNKRCTAVCSVFGKEQYLCQSIACVTFGPLVSEIDKARAMSVGEPYLLALTLQRRDHWDLYMIRVYWLSEYILHFHSYTKLGQSHFLWLEQT